MKKKLRSMVERAGRALLSPNNINSAIRRMATNSSAEYAYNNMLNASVLGSSLDVHDFALKQKLPSGLALEFGVYSGKSINYLAPAFDKIVGFDSFEGLPEDWHSGIVKGHFSVDKIPIVAENVTLIKGWFDESLPSFVADLQPNNLISYLHVDCDLYSSTKTIFEYCGKFLRSGSIIVFDEYFNYPGWENGEFKAFQEFIENSTNVQSDVVSDYSNIGYNFIPYSFINDVGKQWISWMARLYRLELVDSQAHALGKGSKS